MLVLSIVCITLKLSRSSIKLPREFDGTVVFAAPASQMDTKMASENIFSAAIDAEEHHRVPTLSTNDHLQPSIMKSSTMNPTTHPSLRPTMRPTMRPTIRSTIPSKRYPSNALVNGPMEPLSPAERARKYRPGDECNYTDGHWVRVAHISDRQVGLSGVYKTAPNPKTEEQRARYTDALTIDWHINDDSCVLERFSAQNFCTALQGRNLLFIGDSLSRLAIRSLMFMLQNTTIPKLSKVPRLNVTSPGYYQSTEGFCDGASTITFLRTNYMQPDELWEKLLPKHQVVMLNTGAWNRRRQSLENSIGSALQRLKEWDGEVVYRTTPQGHKYCADSTRWDEAETWKTRAPYKKWAGFHERNDYIVRRFRAELPKAKIIDVVPMTEQRPDLHFNPPIDCLHYKLPSVVDYWNWLLLNAMNGRIGN